jgi:hypothetical protein
MIEKGMREMAYSMKKALSVTSGDMVTWNSSGGSASGKVIRVVSSGKINVPDSSFTFEGTEDEPAALIQLYRDGKETDIQVGHKMSSLTKSLDEQLLKHGSHNQKTHAGSRGRGGSGGSASSSGSERAPSRDQERAKADMESRLANALKLDASPSNNSDIKNDAKAISNAVRSKNRPLLVKIRNDMKEMHYGLQGAGAPPEVKDLATAYGYLWSAASAGVKVIGPSSQS